MPDVIFRIRSEGDVKQFLTSIQNDAQSFMTRSNKEMEQFFRSRYGNIFSGGFGNTGTGFGSNRRLTEDLLKSKVGPAVRSARIEFDKLNNTMRITGDMGVRIGSSFISTGQVTSVTGNLADYEAALKRIANARVQLNNARQAGEAGELRAARDLAATTARVSSRAAAPYNRTIADIQRSMGAEAPNRSLLASEYRALRAAGDPIPTYLRDLARQSDIHMRDLRQSLRTETAARDAAITSATSRSTAVSRGRAEVARAEAETQRLVGEARREIQAGVVDKRSAIYAPPQMPSNIKATLDASRQLEGVLRRAGLGQAPGMGADFTQNVVKSANFNAPYLDLIKNVTRVSGEFTNASGQAVRFGAEIDKNGKILTRFGGQLSGVGNFLRMIQRDFVKVIEWTVATTVVFASMGAAINTIKQINEVDKLLQRFAITAQMTAEETRKYFSSLAEVAYQTATPLNEIIKVADDMALATKKAGQSTQDWTRRITEMSNAVGILTNIGGLDTASATEQLTSMMKQLGVETNQLVGILNKVTAVAGGQQQAVADITRGLAVMAEAGKQAGLTIDQQIATVQTLSQVTSKSSAEVATAFKNLVGSIDSPGSIKILTEFGIQVRDAEGNARNFLQIYKDIQDAVESGVIPQGRLKEVIRGISGGPRRAPDAAALLSNVSAIFEVEKTSVNAANEALLANAKVLDTNSAKLTQLKVKLDQLAFEKFATIIRSSVGDLTKVLAGVLDFFSAIPNDVVKVILQLGLFAAGMKVISLIAKAMISIFTSIGGTIAGAVLATEAWSLGLSKAAKNAQAVGTALVSTGLVNGAGQPIFKPGEEPKPTGGKWSKLFSSMGGAQGALTVGLGAVTGAAINQGQGMNATVGGALQGAGMAGIIALPGYFKLIGVAALGLGTVFSALGDKVKKTTDELNASTEAILNASTTYTTTAATIKDLEAQQASLSRQLFVLSDKTDIDSMNARIDVQNKLADVGTALFNANTELTDSYRELNKAVAESDWTGFTSQMLQAARNGMLSADQVMQMRKKLELAYLQQAYPGQFMPSGNIQFNRQPLGTSGGTVGSISGMSQGGAGLTPWTTSVDTSLIDENSLPKLFAKNNEGELEFIAQLPKNLQNVSNIWNIVNKISISNAAEAQKFADALEKAGWFADDINASMMAYGKLQAQLNADVTLGLKTPEQANAAEAQFRFFNAALQKQSALDYTKILPRGIGADVFKQRDREILLNAQNSPTKSYIPGTTDYTQIVSVLDKVIPGLSSMDLDTQIKQLQKLGVNVLFFGKSALQAAAESEELEAEIQAITDAGLAAEESLAGMSASLYEQYAAGEITKKQYDKLQERLKGMTASTKDIYEGLSKSPEVKTVEQLKASVPAMEEVITNLSKVPGFENAASMSIQDLTTQIVTYGANQNLTNKQSKVYGDLLIWLALIISKLPTYKQMVYEVRTVFTSSGSQVTSGGSRSYQQAQQRAMARYRAKYGSGAVNKDIYDSYVQEEMNKSNRVTLPPTTPPIDTDFPTFNPTGGGGGGGGGGSISRQVSSLDIPDEFKGQNVRDLVAKAVAWARKYQRQIPGEAAENRNDLVAIMNGNNRILLQRGIGEEYLRKAMDNLAEQIKKQNELLLKADTIRRIRVGAGDFASIANVPMNSKSGISVGGPGQPINVNLNINGQVMTPAQFQQLANAIAAQIKKSYQNAS